MNDKQKVLILRDALKTVELTLLGGYPALYAINDVKKALNDTTDEPVIIKRVRLVNTHDEHFKEWIAELFDNGDVVCKWGRIGNKLQSKTFKRAGRSFVNEKVDEKLNKGYCQR